MRVFFVNCIVFFLSIALVIASRWVGVLCDDEGGRERENERPREGREWKGTQGVGQPVVT